MINNQITRLAGKKRLWLLGLCVSLVGGTTTVKAYTLNDVFVSAGSGLVNIFKPDVTLVKQLSTGNSGDTYTTGSAFDAAGNFYVTTFGSNVVAKFDPSGALLTRTFATGFNSDPESIVFDKSGNFYVGQADGSRSIQKHNATGANVGSFSPTDQTRISQQLPKRFHLSLSRCDWQ